MTEPIPALFAGYGGFSPRSIPNLALWLDGNDPTTMTFSSGVKISQWNDKSGLGNNVTQANATLQPSYTANKKNGKGVADFSLLTNPYLQNAAGPIVSQPLTVFMAAYAGSATSYFFDATANSNRLSAAFYASEVIGIFGGSGPLNSSNTAFYQAWGTAVMVFNGVTSTIYVNGTSVATGTAGTDTFSTLRIGTRWAADQGLDGFLGEMGVYSGILSVPNVAAITNYLRTKWNI